MCVCVNPGLITHSVYIPSSVSVIVLLQSLSLDTPIRFTTVFRPKYVAEHYPDGSRIDGFLCSSCRYFTATIPFTPVFQRIVPLKQKKSTVDVVHDTKPEYKTWSGTETSRGVCEMTECVLLLLVSLY